MGTKKGMVDKGKSPFSTLIRVYWENTDAGGIVNHTQYMNFAERARTEWLRRQGVPSQKILAEKHEVFFVVKHLEISFIAPAFLDDVLEVTCSCIQRRRVSALFLQKILRGEEQIVQVRVKIASINKAGKVLALPGFLQELGDEDGSTTSID